MKRAVRTEAGFSIVEVMIFLAISGAMFLSAMLFLSGQQNRNEFATGIREIQSQLNDILNDVSTGFYGKTGDFKCTVDALGVFTVVSSSDKQGTNKDCIFVGRAMIFGPNDATFGENTAVLYTLIGRRQTGDPPEDVKTLDESDPQILNNNITRMVFPNGILIKRVTSGGINKGVAVFATKFSGASGSGGITGTQDLDLIAVNATNIGDPISTSEANLKNNLLLSPRNESTGIELCFDSAGTNQHAIIIIGGSSGKKTGTQLIINSGSLC